MPVCFWKIEKRLESKIMNVSDELRLGINVRVWDAGLNQAFWGSTCVRICAPSIVTLGDSRCPARVLTHMMASEAMSAFWGLVGKSGNMCANKS